MRKIDLTVHSVAIILTINLNKITRCTFVKFISIKTVGLTLGRGGGGLSVFYSTFSPHSSFPTGKLAIYFKKVGFTLENHRYSALV